MAEDKYVMTLDAGTGSGRAVIFDLEGNQLAVSQQEWYPIPLPEYPGSQLFDTDLAWEIMVDCIKGAMAQVDARPAQIVGITATSMREGFVLYDRAGAEIWACFNGDARAADEVVELVKEGKIRWYDWSTDSPDLAKVFAAGEHCAAIQMGLSVFGGNLETLKYARNLAWPALTEVHWPREY